MINRALLTLVTTLFCLTAAAGDRRAPYTQHEALAIGLLRGQTPSGNWVGGVVAIAQNECFIALTTAGHNLIDGEGRPTAPLSKIHVLLDAAELPVIEAHTDPQNPSTTPPEDDWAIVIAAKPRCGQEFVTIPPGLIRPTRLPSKGLPVTLACIHHDRPSLRNRTSAEQCRLYPPGQRFAGLYAHKQGEPVGLHSCTAKLGSSGCPLLSAQPGQPARFIGTQIEAHLTTGAGVARLFSDRYQRAYRHALAQMAQLDDPRGQKTAQLSGPN